MESLYHTSLRAYNTFGMEAAAQQLVFLNHEEELEAISALPGSRHILGGGSNVLLTQDLPGVVIRNQLKGMRPVREDEHHVWIAVAAGEVWHDLVLYAIGNNLGGIENLALIPGTVGAAPIQNIGAYGAEVRETIDSVRLWDWETRQFTVLDNEACRFGYRDSIFKRELKEKVLVCSVMFRLAKHPELRTAYGAITQELETMGLPASVKNIAQAVINIRRSKLPDPAVTGNAGSFFKNPEIPLQQYEALLARFPLLPAYPVNETTVKVPAGWLIESCGWKGKRFGDAGVHARQALVLVNYAHATGAEILKLSEDVIASVHSEFGIQLEREVQIW